MQNKLYQEAILEAKAIRASAIANAKASLTETFEPKIQEMLRLKLSEELDEEAEIEENYDEMPTENEMYDAEMSEAELEEILSELNALDEEEDNLNESEEELEEAEDDEAEEGDDEDAEGNEALEGGAVTDETMVVDITVGDLKEVLAGFMGEQSEEPMDDMGGDMEDSGEEDLSLDEILAELEKEDAEALEEIEDIEEGEEIEEAKGQVPGFGSVGGSGTTGYDIKVGGKGRTGYDAGSKKLHEANKTIEVLSEKLKEINLLNAKLLYMNKIFKAKNLNESQKISVVKSFDKATSVKEVKNVYEILNESMKNKPKATLKESYGFASKPAGVAPKRPIVESDPTVDRWQQLVFGNK
jgi:hypothetical protein